LIFSGSEAKLAGLFSGWPESEELDRAGHHDQPKSLKIQDFISGLASEFLWEEPGQKVYTLE
jgi:hypothetical protein